jgi:hypothetical protein
MNLMKISLPIHRISLLALLLGNIYPLKVIPQTRFEKQDNVYKGKKWKDLVLKDLDSFYDPKENYSKFTARVTDRDETGNVLKLFSDNKNIKFFRAGDRVKFSVARLEGENCIGHIRNVDGKYIVVYVKDFNPCWKQGEYFRRGTFLNFEAKSLADRVQDASYYRAVLIKRKTDFFQQLNKINQFLWSYNQQRVKLAADYDKKLVQLEQAKTKALDQLALRKKDFINLQRELKFRLDAIEEDLEFYRIEKTDLKGDRFQEDHHLGLPFGTRPP